MNGNLPLADWDSKLQQTMAEMFPLRSADAAYNKIGTMLSTLGDPFTRIISPKVFTSYLCSSNMLKQLAFSFTWIVGSQ